MANFSKKRYFAGSDCLKGLEMSYFVKYRLTEAYFIYMVSMLLGLEMEYMRNTITPLCMICNALFYPE